MRVGHGLAGRQKDCGIRLPCAPYFGSSSFNEIEVGNGRKLPGKHGDYGIVRVECGKYGFCKLRDGLFLRFSRTGPPEWGAGALLLQIFGPFSAHHCLLPASSRRRVTRAEKKLGKRDKGLSSRALKPQSLPLSSFLQSERERQGTASPLPLAAIFASGAVPNVATSGIVQSPKIGLPRIR